MKTLRLKLLGLFLPLALSSVTFAADWENTRSKDVLPSNILELAGVLKGNVIDGEKKDKAYLLIYPMEEQGQPSGRANVFLLYNEKKTGQVFEGYMIGNYRMALLPVGTDESGRFIEPKPTPAAIVEIKTSRRGPTITISPADNNSKVMSLNMEFDRISDDLELGPALPKGHFQDGGAFRSGDQSVVSTISNSLSASLQIKADKVGLSGVFYTVFELTGLMVLRPEVISSSLNEYGSPEVKGLAVSVIDGGRESIIIGQANRTGGPSTVTLLKSK